MFKPSAASRQSDVFSSFASHFGESKIEKLNDPIGWHNRFCEYVTSRIDESPYAVLFSDSRGRPNASIRVLVAMLFLKEGFGWSDQELFEQCGFNLLVMRALGFVNLDDEVPVPSTYYLFKKQLFAYQMDHGVDLVGETFRSLTAEQAGLLGVCGDFIRMDSKLIGSNIASCCRLQLVLGCLRVFWKSLSPQQRSRVSSRDEQLLDPLLDRRPHQVVYGLSNDVKAKKLKEYGKLLRRLLKHYDPADTDRYDQIQRIYKEQIAIRAKKLSPKAPEEIPADSLQSAHDPDAAYSAKPTQKVKGYRVNLTETCNPETLNLVTDVQMAPANASDVHFLQSALKQTEALVGEVREVSADGGYNSPEHRAAFPDKALHFTGLQSKTPRLQAERQRLRSR
jgi:hypothetical protein